MSVLIEIEKRHAKRAEIFRNHAQLKPPLLTDSASVKESIKMVKDNQLDLLDDCFMVVEDFSVLLRAFRDVCSKAKIDPDGLIYSEWDKLRLDDQTQEALNRRRNEEAEARMNEAKARGEVPGQLKMVKDDGSVAEEASAVITKKVGE